MSTHSRCPAHGLAYDPSIHSGCVICRRESGEGASEWPELRGRSQVKKALVIGGVVVALVLGALLFRRAMRAEVGAACDGTWGCVKEASCLAFSSGPMPPLLAERGTCFASCNSDADCSPQQACRAGADGHFCLKVARPGEDCGGAVVCPEDWDCLALDDARFRCRASCNDNADCPDRYSCEFIVTTDPLRRLLSPEHLPYPGYGLTPGRYCMPVRD